MPRTQQKKMTPAGFWASSLKIDLFLNCFMGHGYFCLKRSIHLPLLAETERRKEQSRRQEAEMDGNIILMKTAAFLGNPHHFWALISQLKEQKITTIERKRYFWECGHPPLNWKDDLKNTLESLSQCLTQSQRFLPHPLYSRTRAEETTANKNIPILRQKKEKQTQGERLERLLLESDTHYFCSHSVYKNTKHGQFGRQETQGVWENSREKYDLLIWRYYTEFFD